MSSHVKFPSYEEIESKNNNDKKYNQQQQYETVPM